MPTPVRKCLLGIAVSFAALPVAAQSLVTAGHTKLQVPASITVLAETLKNGQTGGEARRIERQLVVLSTRDRHPRAVLILSATTGGGRYQWRSGCEGMKSDARTFVRHPFHVNREECVSIAGPFNLDGSIDSFAPGARARLEAIGMTMPQGGYIAQAMYALESGQMLEVDIFLPLPFTGLAGAVAPDVDGSGLPPALIAWSLSLGEQVRNAMLSVGGEWHLPSLD